MCRLNTKLLEFHFGINEGVFFFSEQLFDDACDEPTLPRSDPPYTWGTGTVEIPDLDILRSGTNRVGLPSDRKQKPALHAVTREEKAEKNSAAVEEKAEKNSAATEEEKAVKNTEVAVEGKAGEASVAVWQVESEEDTGTTSGTTRHSGGPGGRTPELQPRSGESVASAGVWARSH
ncbi:hypothetical protein NDU88_008579 [Pleurodeles waltl]|uniref:Uncharacterized protein n=1 Tax=Pleurodeles waltl TaxID=8319 RepID=A0AAV7PPQ6_PLEWA|nr:hypothetical protein NDU88_008579 [Pleurodeles waltl]